MGVFKGKRPGRQRGVSINDAKYKLDNTNLTDADKYFTFWLDATGGEYTLSYGAADSAAIDFDANAATIETAFELVAGITAVTVTGGGTRKNPFKVLFVTPSSSLTACTFTPVALVSAWQDNARS